MTIDNGTGMPITRETRLRELDKDADLHRVADCLGLDQQDLTLFGEHLSWAWDAAVRAELALEEFGQAGTAKAAQYGTVAHLLHTYGDTLACWSDWYTAKVRVYDEAITRLGPPASGQNGPERGN